MIMATKRRIRTVIVALIAVATLAGCASEKPVARIPDPVVVKEIQPKVIVPKIELPELKALRPRYYQGPDAPAGVSDLIQAMVDWKDCAVAWHDYALSIEDWYAKVRKMVDEYNLHDVSNCDTQ